MKPKKQNKRPVRRIRTAQSSIPFAEFYENGLFQIKSGTYALICEFDNAGYLSKTDPEQERKYNAYCRMLRELPNDVHYQEILYNIPVDADAYKTIISSQSTFRDEYEETFFGIQSRFADGSRREASRKRRLVALSCKVQNGEDPYNKLADTVTGLKARFKEMGAGLRILEPEAALSEIYRFYHPFEGTMPALTPDLYEEGLTAKDILAPDGISFRIDSICPGADCHVKVFSLGRLNKALIDTATHVLLNNDLSLVLSKHVEHIDKEYAIKKLRAEIDDYEGQKQRRLAKNKENGTTFIPPELEQALKARYQRLEALSGDEEMTNFTLYVGVYAKTREELAAAADRVKSLAITAVGNLSEVRIMTEEAFNSLLPLGQNYLERSKPLLTSETAVLTPFTYESYMEDNGFFYGYNAHNNEPVILNRKLDKSSNGFVFGKTGSGKGIWVKHEISNILFQPSCRKDDVIVVDPSGEYIPLAQAVGGQVVRLSPVSDTHLNPLHISAAQKKLLGTSAATASKISHMIALMSRLKGEGGLTATEVAIVDEAASTCLRRGHATLESFVSFLQKSQREEAQQIALWLSRYVSGSVTLFAGEHTEAEKNRFTVFALQGLAGELRDAAMLAMLERIEERMMVNFTQGKWTWIYIDEMHRYFDYDRNPYAAERFARLYSEARKFGAILTGITQLPKPVTESRDGSTMLSNSRFISISELDEANIAAIADTYELNDEQKRTLRAPDVGQYVLRTHNAPMSVKLLYPGAKHGEENLLYDLFSTSFEERESEELAAFEN